MTYLVRAVFCAALAVCLAGCTAKGPTGPAPGSPDYMSAEEAQQAAEALVGTTWLAGDFTVTFHEPPEILIEGGPLQETDPEGIIGHYTFENGLVTVTAQGETRTGSWDGERLIVDGLQAKPL